MSIKFKKLNNTIIKCKKCPRLFNFIKKISLEKRKQNINEKYWGKPVTGFGDLNAKFKVALAEFSKLGITGVIQGDLMFTDDLSKETIEGVSYYTFQPNTIVYMVPENTPFGRKIKNSKLEQKFSI